MIPRRPVFESLAFERGTSALVKFLPIFWCKSNETKQKVVDPNVWSNLLTS